MVSEASVPGWLALLICGKAEHHGRKGIVKQTCLPMAARKQKERERNGGRGDFEAIYTTYFL